MTLDPNMIVAGGGMWAALKTDAGKNLVGPITEEFGLALSDIAKIYRFYQGHILGMIFKRWEESHGDKPPITPEQFKKILPLLQLASVQNDEELQAKWAALLENTANANDGVLPSFGQTLSQLTSDEAKFLDGLFALASKPKAYLADCRPGMEPFDYVTLIKVYDPSINPGIGPAERQLYEVKMSADQLANYDRLTRAELVIQDLVRLGIIGETHTLEPSRFADFGIARIPIEQARAIFSTRYSFTHYGLSFVRALTVKHERSKE
jgi:Abortive infection alpha